MKNTNNLPGDIFEPCHIASEVSPFSAHERKSEAHTDRFSAPINTEEGTDVTAFSEKDAKKG